MKLILTRHGKTLGNEQHINEGHMPGELSKEGKLQAKKLALRLKKEKIDVIYSSDLKRASDTAKEIAKYHKKIPIHFVSELREFDAGDITGKVFDQKEWENPPKNVERPKNVMDRAKKILDKIYDTNKDSTVLIVAHAQFNKALVATIFNEPEDNMWKYDFSNASISIFELKEDKKHRIRLLNCTKHLN